MRRCGSGIIILIFRPALLAAETEAKIRRYYLFPAQNTPRKSDLSSISNMQYFLSTELQSLQTSYSPPQAQHKDGVFSMSRNLKTTMACQYLCEGTIKLDLRYWYNASPVCQLLSPISSSGKQSYVLLSPSLWTTV